MNDDRTSTLEPPPELRDAGEWLKAELPTAVSLAFFGVMVFTMTKGPAFVLDDILLTQSPPEPMNLQRLWLALTQAGNRHLVTLSFSFSQWLTPITPGWTGEAPMGYRGFNIGVHVAAAIVLYGIVGRLLRRINFERHMPLASTTMARATATLFIVHPLQTESVTYISQRAQSMMGLFQLLAVYFVIVGFESRRRWLWYGAAIIATLCALDCKPHVILAPLVILLLDYAFLSKSWQAIWRSNKGLHLAFGLVWLAIGFMAWRLLSDYRNLTDIGQAGVLQGLGPDGMSGAQYAASQPQVICHYLLLSIWPVNLCIDYAWPLAREAIDFVPYAIAMMALLGATLWALWQHPAWGFVGAWFFLNLAATSTIIPRPDLCVEHRMYLPLISVIVAVQFLAWSLYRRFVWPENAPPTLRQRWTLSIPYALPMIALIVATVERNGHYRHPVFLWQATVDVAPNNPRAQSNLASALGDVGKSKEALPHFEVAARLSKLSTQEHYSWANALRDEQRLDEAIEHYEKSIALDPTFAGPHNNLAEVLLNKGRLDEGVAQAKLALQLQPNLPNAWFILGNGHFDQKRFADAVAAYEKAVALKPDFPEAYENMATAMIRLGRYDDAEKQLEKAISLMPTLETAQKKLKRLRERPGRK